jgi:hypothetical protein
VAPTRLPRRVLIRCYVVALSVIGFFYTIIDRYNFTTKRSNVYDIEAPHEELHESESH